MKQFNLQRAIAGDSLITRNGKAARIICFDKEGSQPIVALISTYAGNEAVACFNTDGTFYAADNKFPIDLFMAPKITTLWFNAYKSKSKVYLASNIYPTKEAAESAAGDDEHLGSFPLEIMEE